MPNLPISDLPNASTPLSGDELIPLVQGGITRQTAISNLPSGGGGVGVSSVSVVSANGLAGAVATPSTTPAITLRTTVNGIAYGNGTSFGAVTVGTGLSFASGTLSSTGAPATSGSSLLYGNGSGGFSNATIGSGLTFVGGTLSTSGGATTWATLGDKTGASGPSDIALGQNAVGGTNSVIIGLRAGEVNTVSGKNNSVLIGVDAGATDNADNTVAIGSQAGQLTQSNYSVAIGNFAGYDSQNQYSVGIGYSAGKNFQGFSAISIGRNAGLDNQGGYGIAIGISAGQTNQDANAVAIGNNSGATSQGGDSIAIGNYSGNQNLGQQSIAIGYNSGGLDNTTPRNIAIGVNAGGGQQMDGIAIGYESGNAQGNYAIAIGAFAGNGTQATKAIAIGPNAGEVNQGANSIAIGWAAGNVNQAANSITINATLNGLNNTTPYSLVIDPIRTAEIPSNALYYNTTTKEVTYGPVVAPIGGFLTHNVLSSSSYQFVQASPSPGWISQATTGRHIYLHAGSLKSLSVASSGGPSSLAAYSAATNGVIACKTWFFMPAMFRKTMTFSYVGMDCVKAAAGSTTSTIQILVYSDNSGVPGTLLYDWGTATNRFPNGSGIGYPVWLTGTYSFEGYKQYWIAVLVDGTVSNVNISRINGVTDDMGFAEIGRGSSTSDTLYKSGNTQAIIGTWLGGTPGSHTAGVTPGNNPSFGGLYASTFSIPLLAFAT